MADVFKIADFLISVSNDSKNCECMTNLRLNKLLYFAQGQYLAKTGHSLFDEELEAWPYGPVVPEIYDKYKVYGKECISESNNVYNDLPDDITLFLIDILREYGKCCTYDLVSESHRTNAPWDRAIKSEKIINKTSMQRYFSKPSKKIKTFSDVLSAKKLPTVGYRDNEGYLVLPKDFDD